ncbi:hypothetical protein [Scytonema millei]|uniref:Uncharacterized protein n=1 Tax=Scytonema millei VB511283 TaxID=1245923 RepID=A0A9X5E3X1_9CYAN|nr:hypothetical protein [Scytonema millei]NHC34433.1 hypothetical protein [Scytonema millei VB511283]
MLKTKLIHPAYYQIVRRIENAWEFRHGKIFYRSSDRAIDTANRELEYGLTKSKIVIELFRINGGRAGYYLVNLKDRSYYYCGLTLEDVKTILQQMGIGRPDPMENSNG